MKLKAIHSVESSDPKTRKRVVFAPGVVFEADDEMAEFLLSSGAAVKFADGPVKKNADEPTGLHTKTKAQLLAYAEEQGIEVDKTAPKADILIAIEDAEAAEDLGLV